MATVSEIVIRGNTRQVMDAQARTEISIERSRLFGNRNNILDSIYRNRVKIDKNDLIVGSFGTPSMDNITPSSTEIRTVAPFFIPKNSYVYVGIDYDSTKEVYVAEYDVEGQYKEWTKLTSTGNNVKWAHEDEYIVLSFKTFTDVDNFAGSIYICTPGDYKAIESSQIISGTSGRNGTNLYFVSNSKRLRTFHGINIQKGDTVSFEAGENITNIYVEINSADGALYELANSGWIGDGQTYTAPADGICMLYFKNSGDADISEEDYDANVKLYHTEAHEFIDLEFGYYRSNTPNRLYGAQLNVFMDSKINKLYLEHGGASAVEIIGDYADTYLEFFGSGQMFISASQYSGTIKQIPSNCKYIGIYTENLNHSNIEIKLYGNKRQPFFEKRYARSLDFPTTESEMLGFVVKDDVFSIARLILPPNYSVGGNPVPLIVWMRGSAGSSTWAEEIGTNSSQIKYLSYLRDEGFAVCSMHTWGSYFNLKYGANSENASPYPSPTCFEVFKKGIEYITSRYNIDAGNVHLLGYSQGGQLESYCVTHPIIPIKSISMFSPVNDYLSMPGDQYYTATRKCIAEDLGLEGDVDYFVSTAYSTYSPEGIAFWRGNLSKLNLLNEAWTGLVGGTDESRFNDAIENGSAFWENGQAHPERTDIYLDYEYTKLGKVPTKIWMGADDTATPYQKTVEFVKQLNNGGCLAILRTMPDGDGHSAAAYANLVSSVTTALEIEYQNIPVAWIEAVEFMRECMVKS